MANTRAVYTEEDKAKVYVVLATNEGNVKRTARETGYPENTVRRWRNQFKEQPPSLEMVAPVAADFLIDAERVRNKALRMIEVKLPNATVSALNVTVGVLTDKINLIRGLDVKRVEHTHVLPSAEEVRALMTGFTEGMQRLAEAREAEIVDAEIVEQPALPPGS